MFSCIFWNKFPMRRDTRTHPFKQYWNVIYYSSPQKVARLSHGNGGESPWLTVWGKRPLTVEVDVCSIPVHAGFVSRAWETGLGIFVGFLWLVTCEVLLLAFRCTDLLKLFYFSGRTFKDESIDRHCNPNLFWNYQYSSKTLFEKENITPFLIREFIILVKLSDRRNRRIPASLCVEKPKALEYSPVTFWDGSTLKIVVNGVHNSPGRLCWIIWILWRFQYTC